MKRCKLGDIAEFKTGPFGTQFKANEYTQTGVPVINVKNIGNGLIIEDELEYISDKTKQRLSSHIIHHGDIVFARKGSVERHAYIDKKYEGWVQGSDCIKATISSEYNSEYISYYLYLEFVKQQLLTHAVGSTMPSMNTDILSDIDICYPTDATQIDKVVSLLRNIKNKIALNNRLNATLEAMAKTLYDYWFVQFDFPDEKGRPYKTSGGKMVYNEDLGREIPAGWEAGNLNVIAEYINGLACQRFRPQENENSLPVVKIREIHEGIQADTERVFANIPEENIIEDGDILFSWSATLEVNYWIGGKAGLNQHIFKVQPKEGFNREYVYHQLREYVINFVKIAEARKTTMGHITQDHLNFSRIPIPPRLKFSNTNASLARKDDSKQKRKPPPRHPSRLAVADVDEWTGGI